MPIDAFDIETLKFEYKVAKTLDESSKTKSKDKKQKEDTTESF